ncbi:hypothetical protein SS1G_00620 [Sclerotinia sclerotiorum 1980 UF-70]|uniref:Uncharacterized protein n=1 Tax=Sclerotinia sclerotiorum (strain ATCC 18683 / 1980 / Ss-1) TaxID=665079 RepID=A7E5P5_SCLS1|nr:hypothetical protein SS1G_00620 [Sclerotinia sclerotiorum 1980 UF-70]EDN91217.1 hypothetical protein SS1G_00620 [Sclerotinia sclerotiorum 1980 UF-70]
MGDDFMNHHAFIVSQRFSKTIATPTRCLRLCGRCATYAKWASRMLCIKCITKVSNARNDSGKTETHGRQVIPKPEP